ncbi:hypothetical protein DB30_00670 [Enhygromyxa salina]|uniref:T6SS Phospholipase effector Tle1-like catalytic domain-containing protein n=1 Tax=Enhygromyxa salina TaxID=215803 RepID=A0A0C2D9Z8_9BACT|nr:DUF2235 domain-containing protein [Enhygromyxa salina]KIG18385.1 hypothetical protein DB30_00670 [Enhygromyxa salina]
MLPIHIFDGSERYLLVRGGTKLGNAADQVEPGRARALLEVALRRQDPQLIQRLSVLLNLRDEEPRDVAAQALARVAGIAASGGDLMLLRARQAEVQRVLSPKAIEVEAPRLEAPAEEVEEETPPLAKTTIRVSLFFDGTANNRANTRDRLRNNATYQDNVGEGSFENDYTNVSRLETLLIGDSNFEHSYSIYVEGIGTQNHQGDSNYGMGTGLGDTGVVAKVQAGVRELLRGIRELGLASGVIIERIHLDAFGFSRGAAGARHFVHDVLNGDNPLQPRIEALGHTVELLEVNFVGLFDTVASYGVKHTNDTADLNLDAVRSAKKVVQLAAAEEHRANFRLTNIASAIGAGVGVEIYMPGVHSDVGGGYRDNSEEVGLQILDFDQFSNDALERRFARERAWLIDSGWYRASEIAEVNFWNELKVTRRGIRNGYNRIPLKHMADFATETGLTFESVTAHHPIPGALAEIYATVNAHVAAHLAGTASTAEHWINMRTPAYRRLRHDYLHFSASYGGFNQPQFSAGGAMSGRRQRIVQAG